MQTHDRDVINVKIGDDHSFGCLTVALGRTGEHVITQLNITIPEKLKDYWAYLDFKKPSGAKVKTARLDATKCLIEYEIPQGLLDEDGNLETQLVLQNEDGEIWKSAIKKFVVLKSIDASDDIPYKEDFVSEVEKTLAETEKTLRVIDDRLGLTLEIDPVFANNSWETIAEVAKRGIAQNFWKVGDCKLLTLGGTKLVPTNTYNVEWVDWENVYQGLNSQDHGSVLYFYDWDKFCTCIGNKAGSYVIECPNTAFRDPFVIYKEGVEVYRGTKASMGVGITDYTESPDRWILEVEEVEDKTALTQYPLQIIGFNHDKVTNPYDYGRQRAGLTLQLGCSRSQYGDKTPSLFSGAIDGITTPKGYYYSPTRVRADYSLGATNWADGGFRVALQNLFAETEIEPFMVEVQKYTSQYYYEANAWEAPMLTRDKVFLLSEFEIFGKQHQAPAQEGEQYEFYKDGYSKFMWHKDTLSDVNNALLWLRSAQKAQVNENTKDSISACCCYLTVNSRNPLSVNYQPSAAGNVSEARAGLIAPCICI